MQFAATPVDAWIDAARGDQFLATMCAAAEQAIARYDFAETEHNRVVHTHGRAGRRAYDAKIAENRAGEVLVQLTAAIRAYLGARFSDADLAVQSVADEH